MAGPVKSVQTKQMLIAAPLGKRFFAFLIDLFIVFFFIVSPFTMLYEQILPSAPLGLMDAFSSLEQNPVVIRQLNIISFFMAVYAVLYFVLLEYLGSQTVGKKFLNLFVVSETGTLSFWQCIVRNLELLPFFPFIIFWILDPVSLKWTGQRFFERISKTRTIQHAVVVTI